MKVPSLCRRIRWMEVVRGTVYQVLFETAFMVELVVMLQHTNLSLWTIPFIIL